MKLVRKNMVEQRIRVIVKQYIQLLQDQPTYGYFKLEEIEYIRRKERKTEIVYNLKLK